MNEETKKSRYNRIFTQLQELMQVTDDPTARMATIVAVLYHKFGHFFKTGFYILRKGVLTIGPYQGTLCCQVLEKNKGVCWSAINKNKTIIVPDVDKFPGHIACDSRSKSEIAVPIRNIDGIVEGVLDIDSKELEAFDSNDLNGLEMIIALLNNPLK
ncbi:MAG: GAF domain-containing protein [Brevinematales bacterium]|jgi:GAF domain-containing protein